MFGKKDDAKKEAPKADGTTAAVAAVAVMDPDTLMAEGGRIILFSTTATLLAMSAAEQMCDAFPPEQVKAIKEKFSKFNELNAKRKEGDALDATQNTLVSETFLEMEKLDPKGYQKDKAKVVRPAYAKLGLAVAADLAAATQVPGFIKNGQATVSSLSSNPFQITKLKKITGILGTLGVIAKTTPDQIKAFQTVRSMAKTIAEAENFKLGEPAVPITDMASLTSAAKSVPEEG
ncbi:MAG: hypothetical protein HXX12_13040 [Geothrix sp.]|uniref:hypothetical protein n=1 Tax=Geothrix sp. TaxID=1962974 RepID=UPI0018595135|nr:hypothetical protein [Geothrix sp.]NWJ41882.1 hypothetical protein [Geothrix sp.]WIL20145.1 MAG: hypothetical protein QOZ81_002691 [Geothrix sp.]